MAKKGDASLNPETTGQWLGGKPRVKGCLGNWWMHVVVSSSRVVFQQRITSFAIVCFGVVVVPGVSLHVSFFRALVRFVFDALHCSSDLFVVLCFLVLRHRPVTS